jgi:hypothetical protein
MQDFRVVYRNYGHWDIWQNNERIYRIRGGPGKYWISGEHSRQYDQDKEFKTVQACMTYITDLLMYELIIAEGQKPIVIEKWHV